MTARLRRLLAMFNNDPFAIEDYCRDNGIQLSKHERKYLEQLAEGA